MDASPHASRANALVRRLGIADGIAIGVGSVIGVGIFRTTGDVLRATGTQLAAVAVWIAVGLVSLAGASAFGRVAVRVPEAGGPYAYVREALGPRAAFVDGWFGAAVSIPARQAAQMAILGEVLAVAAGGRARAWALVTLAVLYVVHLAGVHVGAQLQRALSALKIVLIVSAVVVAFTGPAAAESTQGASLPPLPLGLGLAGAFYTYLGWHDVTHLSEELREPSRSLPRVLVGTVGIVLVVYVAWVIALAYAYGDGPIAQGDLPVRALARSHFGARGEAIVTWGMLACMVGAAAEGVLVRPRLWYALARDGIAPRVLGRLDRRGVPRVALTVQCALMAILVALGSFAELLVVLSLAQTACSVLEAVSAIVLERRWGTRFPIRATLFAATNATLAAVLAAQNPRSFFGALGVLAAFGVIAFFVRLAPAPEPTEGA